MFPRGPRFAPQKISDVPGPNSYDLNQESHLDAYKRGAFLEKTDRFSQEKPSEVPGPGSYNTATAMNTQANCQRQRSSGESLSNRYQALQRKVEDLEKLHNSTRKADQAEIERLKQELSRAQKSNSDQADRLDKQKKHTEALDHRVQELKKAALGNQAEIKDLKVKLKMSEHERTQLSTKQGDLSDAKKALQNMMMQRREDAKESEKKLSELEKALAGEKKKREDAEVKLGKLTVKCEEDGDEARAEVQDLKRLLDVAENETKEVRSSLEATEDKFASREETLVAQLEQRCSTLARVAEEYGRLASSTIPVAVHSQLKLEHVALQQRNLRAERKLANSEGQITELANLIRHSKDQNELLTIRLRDVEDEKEFYRQSLELPSFAPTEDAVLERDLYDLQWEDQRRKRETAEALDSFSQTLCSLHELSTYSHLSHLSSSEETGHQQSLQLISVTASFNRVSSANDALTKQLDGLRTELCTTKEELDTMTRCVERLNTNAETLEKQIEEKSAAIKKEAVRHEDMMKKEKEANARLLGTMRKAKMAEEGLRAEIEQLTAELTDAERFQEAYYNLTDEVDSLIARKALAEDEAFRLSKFNAEILGHQNPAQRIVYVDRIRRELADTKQKVLVITREREAAEADVENLRNELTMYKSVVVPLENKPRTHITRVIRQPLSNQSTNIAPALSGNRSAKDAFPGLESIPGDMTLDEFEISPVI